MNRQLPKPIKEALARQAAGDVHPSADALTAFVEHSLPQRESQRVTEHLAQCADCREVVFLASNAMEEPSGAEQKLAAATATRLGWRRWWVWVPAIAAALVIVGIVSQPLFKPGQPERAVAVKGLPPGPPNTQQPVTAAPARESESQPLLNSSAKIEAEKPTAKARVRTKQEKPDANLTETVIADNIPREGPATPTPVAVPKSVSPSSEALGIAAVPVPAAPTHNTFVGGEGQGASSFVAGTRPQAMLRAASGAHGFWRVTSDGHLEHATTPGNWTPVLTDQPATFRVVSVVGNNIWAGGSGGALFHSSDGGQNWSKQPLAADAGAIVSIRFSDAEHGVVITDGGSQWGTSDGGVTWTKE